MGVLRAKAGVRFDRIAPGGMEIISALVTLAGMQPADLEITCGTEGHPPTDHHTLGEAYDVALPAPTGDGVLAFCQKLLGSLPPRQFTVLYEVKTADQVLPATGDLSPFLYINAGATAPHVHVQVKNGQTYP